MKRVIKTLKSLVEQQEDEEVRAIYISGPHKLSDCYKKIEVDSVKWYSMDSKAQIKHVERFWRYRPTLDDQFDRPNLCGRKNPGFKRAFDRLDKKEKKSGKSFIFQDPTLRKRYRMSCSSVLWYRAWLIDVRKTLGIGYFQVKVLPTVYPFQG